MKFKRILSLCLALAMLLSMAPNLPLNARAETDPNGAYSPDNALVGKCDVNSYSAEQYWTSYAADCFTEGEGTPENPYKISSAEELALLALNVNQGISGFDTAYYQMTADIDLSAHQWVPIGKEDLNADGNFFSGSFDGNGNTISGMNIYSATGAYIGLFSAVQNGTVKNLRITNAVIDLVSNSLPDWDFVFAGLVYVGGLAGMYYGDIQNCSIENIVIRVETTACGLYVGGLAGSMEAAIHVEHTYVSGSIDVLSAKGIEVGGIAGYLCGEAYIGSSSFVGNIRSENNGHTGDESFENQGVTFAHNVGGLLGSVYFSQLVMENCYSIIDSNAKSDASIKMGGAIGWLNNTENDSIELQNVYSAATMFGSCQFFEDGYCGLFNGGSSCSDGKIDKRVGLGSEMSRQVIKNCGYFAHDKFYKYRDCDEIGAVVLTQKAYMANDINIYDFFTQTMQFDPLAWNLADGHYPTLLRQESMAIPTEFEHDYVNHICIYCGAADKSLEVQGAWGDNLTWEIADGILTIRGEGHMAEGVYNAEISRPEYPWSYYGFNKVVIDSGVTSISPLAFFNCVSLTSVILNDVTTIGYWAFYGCTGLVEAVIPDCVQYIGSYAFYGCESLTSVRIPSGVTFISPSAFQRCDNLSGIWVDTDNAYYSSDSYGVLFNKDQTKILAVPGGLSGEYFAPRSVVDIGDFAFSDCLALSKIIFQGDVPNIDTNAFCRVKATVCYPIGNETWTADVMQDYGGDITWVAYEKQVASGDANGDGKINTTDAKLVMQYELGLIGGEELDLTASDVNGDGKYNTTDAKLIMQMELGLIDEFPKI